MNAKSKMLLANNHAIITALLKSVINLNKKKKPVEINLISHECSCLSHLLKLQERKICTFRNGLCKKKNSVTY